MVKANECTAVPKGIPVGPIFAMQNTFKYKKKYLLGSVIPRGQVS